MGDKASQERLNALLAALRPPMTPVRGRSSGGMNSSNASQPSSTGDGGGSCSATDIEAYKERVSSFTIPNWFAKPQCLSPLHCARYGWRNTGLNELTCVSCGAVASAAHLSLERTADAAIRDEAILLLVSAHRSQCRWRFCQTPLPLVLPEPMSTEELRSALSELRQSIPKCLLERLPVSSRFIEAHAQDQKLARALTSSSLNDAGNGDKEDKSEEKQAEKWPLSVEETLLRLILFYGWHVVPANQRKQKKQSLEQEITATPGSKNALDLAKDIDFECELCQRRVSPYVVFAAYKRQQERELLLQQELKKKKDEELNSLEKRIDEAHKEDEEKNDSEESRTGDTSTKMNPFNSMDEKPSEEKESKRVDTKDVNDEDGTGMKEHEDEEDQKEDSEEESNGDESEEGGNESDVASDKNDGDEQDGDESDEQDNDDDGSDESNDNEEDNNDDQNDDESMDDDGEEQEEEEQEEEEQEEEEEEGEEQGISPGKVFGDDNDESDDESDDESGDDDVDDDAGAALLSGLPGKKVFLQSGTTEDNAICLDDSDDEDDVKGASQSNIQGDQYEDQEESEGDSDEFSDDSDDQRDNNGDESSEGENKSEEEEVDDDNGSEESNDEEENDEMDDDGEEEAKEDDDSNKSDDSGKDEQENAPEADIEDIHPAKKPRIDEHAISDNSQAKVLEEKTEEKKEMKPAEEKKIPPKSPFVTAMQACSSAGFDPETDHRWFCPCVRGVDENHRALSLELIDTILRSSETSAPNERNADGTEEIMALWKALSRHL